MRNSHETLSAWFHSQDLLDCIGSLFGRKGEHNPACYVEAWLVQIFSVASFLWTTVIAFVLYRTVVLHRTDSEALEPWFHAYVWGTSLLLAIIPQAGGVYGDAGFWCWISDKEITGAKAEHLNGHVFRLICFYVPLWLAIIWNAFAFISVVREIRMAMHLASYTSNETDKEATQQLKTLQRLGFYPLILIGAYLFGTINRLYQFAPNTGSNFVLFALHVTTSSLKGFFNAIAYGFNQPVRKCIAQSFETYCSPLARSIRRIYRRLRSTATRQDFVQMEEVCTTSVGYTFPKKNPDIFPFGTGLWLTFMTYWSMCGWCRWRTLNISRSLIGAFNEVDSCLNETTPIVQQAVITCDACVHSCKPSCATVTCSAQRVTKETGAAATMMQMLHDHGYHLLASMFSSFIGMFDKV